jgi:hypothetical protein
MSEEERKDGGEGADRPAAEAPAVPAPSGSGAPDGEELSPEEQAALPQDTLLRRLVEDRRVRIAAIAGIPLLVALCAAAAILAHSFGIARSVLVEGPTALAPGAPTSLRIGYSEMDDYGLPHAIRIERLRLEVCPRPAGAGAPVCLPLAEGSGARRAGDVLLHLQVPDVPPGTHPVRIEITAAGRTVAYRFPVRFDRGPGEAPQLRQNGRSPVLPLGASGLALDLVPFDGGIARGWTSALIARVVGPDGLPYAGSLYLLPIGESARSGVPPEVHTDAVGLAAFALRSETFDYRLAISAVPFPEMDPLEVEVGLLPEEVMAQAALLEIPFRPMVAPLRVTGDVNETKDRPFLAAGGRVFAFLDRPTATPTAILTEVWQDGRLLRLGTGESPGGPLDFGDFTLPPGLVFVQAHRPGDPFDSVVGRHVWAGTSAGSGAAEVGALLAALDWPGDERAWLDVVRTRLPALDGTTLERLGRYALSRRDSVWYEPGTLFDSRPADEARVAELRDQVKSAMAWGIGSLAFALVALAAFTGVLSVRDVRRRRAVERTLREAAVAEGREPAPRTSIYDRGSRWGQGVLLRMAVVFFIVALALAGIAFLVWGMKQMYMAP